MLYCYIIIGIITYLAIAGFIFGYVKAYKCNNTDALTLSWLWPAVISFEILKYLFFTIVDTPAFFGFKLAEKRININNAKLIEQQKLQFEFQQAEKELEEQL